MEYCFITSLWVKQWKCMGLISSICAQKLLLWAHNTQSQNLSMQVKQAILKMQMQKTKEKTIRSTCWHILETKKEKRLGYIGQHFIIKVKNIWRPKWKRMPYGQSIWHYLENTWKQLDCRGNLACLTTNNTGLLVLVDNVTEGRNSWMNSSLLGYTVCSDSAKWSKR